MFSKHKSALFAGLLVALVPQPTFAQERVAGWSATSSADATMDVGQRFDCTRPDCPETFACIHAAAPPRPAGARWLKTEDVTNPDVWPWGPVEAWFAAKLNEIRPGSVDDPLAPSSQWAGSDEPITFAIGENDFARRVYDVTTRGGRSLIPIYFWTSKGRLFTMFCHLQRARLSDARPAIHDLLSALHPGEPKADIPTRF